ncbi:unnamed protein product [Diabrotica balteata]|uniref:CHK kinase-like domain-containing protein n=1 Tax=Diabrotica balteata TaxID=107213 RepID=A0A9N9T171_DIABA|nr:unnamed protein product [Diabrotica balteata]
MEKIKNFEELIRDYIGPNKSVVDTKVSNLTAPGENYLSEIIKIDVVLQDKDTNNHEDLSLVAKLCVENEFFGPTYNLTKNEVIFYTDIVPPIKNFHKKHGLPPPSFYPDYAGGRLNLAGETDKPDMDAILILENLVPKGYKNLDRHIGFDLTTTRLILKDLAKFHAAPMAMRLKDSEEFATIIKKLSLLLPHKEKKDKSPPKIFEIITKELNKNKKYKAAEAFGKMLADFKKRMDENPESIFSNKPIKGFATVIHHDMWINNTMQVIENGTAIKNKFVDFQMCQIGSPTIDLIFLLFSSVELSCLQNNLDNLIEYYYREFVDIIKQLDLYTDEYSYQKFLEEIKTEGREGMIQAIFMIPTVIFGEKGKAVQHEESSLTVEDIPDIALKKILLMCEEATERDIVPPIKNFHKEHGLPPPSFYPDYAGGRLNLTGETEKPDMDAILILENLVPKGYKNLDRHVGFDLTTTKLILKDLAKFHAAPMAMRLKDSEEFATIIKKLSLLLPPKEKDEAPPKIFEILTTELNKIKKYKAAEAFGKMLVEFKRVMDDNPESVFNNKPIKGFSTIIHHDMWINNTMQVIENEKGKAAQPGDSKITIEDIPEIALKKLILLCEEAAERGYKNLDRHVGFDLATSKLILKDLAMFHAVPLAIRLLEPEEFTRLTKKISISLPPKREDKKPPTIFKIMIETLSANDEYKKAADKLTKMLTNFSKAMENDPKKLFNKDDMRTFSTIVHQDVWINNTMQLIENDVAVKNKFVDFQMCQLGLPADDLIFFLFSSVEYNCLKNNLNNLIKYYYEEFICILKQLGIYTDDFSYEKFLEEFRAPGKLAIVRTLFMLPKVIFGEKGKASAHGKLDEMTVEDIHPIALKKMILLCVEAAERDWM